jgi:hypothetical protein
VSPAQRDRAWLASEVVRFHNARAGFRYAHPARARGMARAGLVHERRAMQSTRQGSEPAATRSTWRDRVRRRAAEIQWCAPPLEPEDADRLAEKPTLIPVALLSPNPVLLQLVRPALGR